MEVVLHKLGYIQTYNFGDLQKIGWGRATRTDKRVHALQNCFSCKLHIRKDADWEEHRAKINAELPKDQRIFALFPVGMRFNAKNCTSHREYSYFLPTFLLQPIAENYLGRPADVQAAEAEESKQNIEKEGFVQSVGKSGGVKRIIRPALEQDAVDPEEKHLDRNIDHISSDMIKNVLYKSRLNETQKAELHSLF